MGKWGAAIGIVLIVLGGGRSVAAQGDLASTPSITVAGAGEIAAPPDTATVRAGVVTEAKTAAAAVEQNSQAMQRVLAALGEAGIAGKDIQTEQFDVSPQYRPDPEQRDVPRLVGYQASNVVRVRVRELEGIGSVLDRLVTAGANRMHGIAFSVGEPTALLDEGRKRAVADAQRKAELYAQAAGVRLGRLLRLEEAGAPGPIPGPYFARAEAMAQVPVQPGELELSVRITATFAIE